MFLRPKFEDSEKKLINNYYLYVVNDFNDFGIPDEILSFFLLNGELYSDIDFKNQKAIIKGNYYFFVSPFKMVKNELIKEICSDMIFLDENLEIIKLPFICDFFLPVQRNIDIYKSFAWSDEDSNGKKSFHLGKDYKTESGTPVYSIADGMVTLAAHIKGFGSFYPPAEGGAVIIKHKNTSGKDFYALYGHLKISNTIMTGTFVKKGDFLGYILELFNAKISLPHLHFGIYVDDNLPEHNLGCGESLNGWADPEEYLKKYCWIQKKL